MQTERAGQKAKGDGRGVSIKIPPITQTSLCRCRPIFLRGKIMKKTCPKGFTDKKTLHALGISLAFGLCAGVATVRGADEPAPVVAIGFENAKTVQSFFGGTGQTVSGLHGKGISGLKGGGANSPVSADKGTVMAWVKLARLNPSGISENSWLLIGGERYGLQGNTRKPSDKDPLLVEIGDWHHWAVVWRGTQRQLFIDGKLVTGKDGNAAFADAPRIQLVLEDNGTLWEMDDFKMYAEPLTDAQIASARDRGVANDLFPGVKPVAGVELVAEKFKPLPDLFGKDQIVVNPALVPEKNDTAGLLPTGWSVTGNKDWIKVDANGVTCTTGKEGYVSLLASTIRGYRGVTPGHVYQIGISYRLKKGSGTALLRFRNEIDKGTYEFELPEGDWQKRFFYTVAPEDYDAGLYYLEVVLDGAGTDFALRGIYCRHATESELLTEKVTVFPPVLTKRGVATLDERWIEGVPSNACFMKPDERTAAWAPGQEGNLIGGTIAADGDSFWYDHPPEAIWKQLTALKSGVPRLSISPPKAKDPSMAVPGRLGLDPLPARSTYAAALLFGIGAVDSGVGSFQFKRLHDMLSAAGYFDPATVFVPFWQGKGFYKARYEFRENPVDFRKFFKGNNEAPLFGHTAPGVLVSGYLNGDKLLLVMVNTTRQMPGKLGHLWVDHARIFKNLEGGTALRMKDGRLSAVDLETGAKGTTFWDRIAGGYITDIWPNVAVAPGDYRLILVENKK